MFSIIPTSQSTCFAGVKSLTATCLNTCPLPLIAVRTVKSPSDPVAKSMPMYAVLSVGTASPMQALMFVNKRPSFARNSPSISVVYLFLDITLLYRAFFSSVRNCLIPSSLLQSKDLMLGLSPSIPLMYML